MIFCSLKQMGNFSVENIYDWVGLKSTILHI